METTTADKIRVKQMQIQVEKDPIKKQDLQTQLRKLQLKKEIEDITGKMNQMG